MGKTMVIGAGGMIGRKLVADLLVSTEDTIIGYDLFLPDFGNDRVTAITGNVTDADFASDMVAHKPDTIFFLASIVSGEAETDFVKGWTTNANAMERFLEAIRLEHLSDGYCPKLIFTSSIAVFGPPYPDKIPDDFRTAPATSYGAQKAICELMIADYSRKGFVDGMSLRLPTICVRPGKPNLAASSFFSGIIREPLNGQKAILPVSSDVRHWHASPRSAVGFLRHAASLPKDALAQPRAMNLPGLSCTVEEQIEALRSIAGQKAVDLIVPEPDDAIIKIVAGWPRNFDPQYAKGLGFQAEGSFEDIIKVYIEEELG